MADLQTIFYQLVLTILRSSKFTSASPGHTNLFTGVEGGNPSIGTDEEIKQAIADIVASLEDVDSDKFGDVAATSKGKGKKSDLTDALSITRQGLDPTAILLNQAKQLAPILVPLLIAAGISDVVVDTSLSPGGIADRRLRRMITQEVNGILDKQTQKNFSIGIRQLTIQSRAGFRNIQGIGTEDNLRQIREGTGSGLRKSNLDYIDFSKGVRELRE